MPPCSSRRNRRTSWFLVPAGMYSYLTIVPIAAQTNAMNFKTRSHVRAPTQGALTEQLSALCRIVARLWHASCRVRVVAPRPILQSFKNFNRFRLVFQVDRMSLNPEACCILAITIFQTYCGEPRFFTFKANAGAPASPEHAESLKSAGLAISVPQPETLDLARLGLRQRVREYDRSGIFVGRDQRFDMVL